MTTRKKHEAEGEPTPIQSRDDGRRDVATAWWSGEEGGVKLGFFLLLLRVELLGLFGLR